MKLLKTFLYLSVITCYSSAYAELRINVKKPGDNTALISVVPFAWQDATTKPPVDVSAIINADLARSSAFKTLPEEQMLTKPTSVADVNFKAWQVLGQDYLVIGKVEKVNDSYKILFQLLSVSQKEQLADYKLSTTELGLRKAAHQMSELIYQKITQKKAVFATRLAFVSREKAADNTVYKLQIADIDGFNAKAIVSSSQPVMSPTWSPDGTKIAYVSFETEHPVIFIQTIATGERKQIAAFSGINSAPAWSPDGNKLAMSLSKDGNPNIYIADLVNGGLSQLTKQSGINTEPTWSPDGATIVFTSNQNGSPQLYKIASNGGNPELLTTVGEYNSNASFSPDGQKIAMVHAEEGSYKIALLELGNGNLSVLTSGNLDESPVFSSNGAMILYASKKENKSLLNAVSVDGKIQQKLDFQNVDVSNPNWAH